MSEHNVNVYLYFVYLLDWRISEKEGEIEKETNLHLMDNYMS